MVLEIHMGCCSWQIDFEETVPDHRHRFKDGEEQTNGSDKGCTVMQEQDCMMHVVHSLQLTFEDWFLIAFTLTCLTIHL